MQSKCVTPQLKELEQWKLSPNTKSATADKFITKKTKQNKKKTRSSVEWRNHCDKIKTVKSKVSRINYPYFAKIFNFLLYVKLIKTVEKVKWLFISGGG